MVVAAIRDNDHGAALVLRFALRRTYAPIDPIKKRGFPLGGGQKQRESPLKVVLIAGEGYKTFGSRFDAEHGIFIAVRIFWQVGVDKRERRFLDKGDLLRHACALIGKNHKRNRLPLPIAVHQPLFNPIFQDAKVVFLEVRSHSTFVIENDNRYLNQLNVRNNAHFRVRLCKCSASRAHQ